MLRRRVHLIRALAVLSKDYMQAYRVLRWSGLEYLEPDLVRMLDKTEKRRLSHYYLGATYLGTFFCSLRGRGKNRVENGLFFNLSALAAFFDDLSEAYREQAGRLSGPETPLRTFAALTDARGVAIKLLDGILSSCPAAQRIDFQNNIRRVFAAELSGQIASGASGQSIGLQKITAEKGGYSVLSFRNLLEPAPGPEERNAILEFGGLVQLSDDIFDVWADIRNGVETLATQYCQQNRTDDLRRYFEGQLQVTRAAIRAIPDGERRTNAALAVLEVLTAITRTCLGHYDRMQARFGKLPVHRREIMVVDMAKWRNRFRVAGALLLPS